MDRSSPPTRRVVEIIELLIERAGVPTRLSDIVKALGLNQATGFMIMKELGEAGWVTRDPADRTFSIGAALADLAKRIDQTPSVAHAARAAAQAGADDTGFAASVTERLANQLVITAFIGGAGAGDHLWRSVVGDRLPFAAPFGPVYAASASHEERLAWIGRSGVSGLEFETQLVQFLDDTAVQGFSVERMSPRMVAAIPVMTKLQAEALSESMRESLDSVLIEIAGTALSLEYARDRRPYVGAISVPIVNQLGCVTHSITLHPFTNLSWRKIEQIGRRLRRAADAISANVR